MLLPQSILTVLVTLDTGGARCKLVTAPSKARLEGERKSTMGFMAQPHLPIKETPYWTPFMEILVP